MQRLLSLLAMAVILLSLGVGSLAHARESLDCVSTSISSSVDHSDGDGDQLPDDDSAMPHHHGGCHGHHVGTPVHRLTMGETASGRHKPVMPPAGRLSAVAPDPALRPPIA
ncbi:hypothetical protein MOK15_16640 [Sphingobium sp. BYY-5]|uniref:hypothetical protein n=1 Tax=Sphingobium sp. BYY-5 TaxID=2926400 RepID=UPI001FA7FC9A|nr:hypothetical protein [Sphingobium sp. BYY-5]MCI4591713.1 hypothetical protein [Sphingobium sp. BYY-5]